MHAQDDVSVETVHQKERAAVDGAYVFVLRGQLLVGAPDARVAQSPVGGAVAQGHLAKHF
mgnify:CR=1 FL=1